MKTIQINLYSFQELSERAQQKAIKNLSSINVEIDWWDSTYEDAKNIGLKIISFDLDRYKHAKGEFTLSAQEVAVNIIRDHGAMCETNKVAQKYLDDSQKIENKYDDPENEYRENELLERDNEFLNELLEEYANILQKEYDYLQSDEAIIETIEANEYTFEADGTLNNG